MAATIFNSFCRNANALSKCITGHVFVLLDVESDFEAHVASDVFDSQQFVEITIKHEATAEVRVNDFEGVILTRFSSKFATGA